MKPENAPASPPATGASPLHNIGEWPSHWARIRPAELAVHDGDGPLDWSTFAQRVARVGGWLTEAGITFGDRVAILLRNRSAYPELAFGTARMGGICLPINLRLTPREIAFQIDDARPAAIFFETDLQDTLMEALAIAHHQPRLKIPVGGENDLYTLGREQAPSLEEAVPVTADDPVILMYTSGTTGDPKGALLPHRKALFNARNAVRNFETLPNDRVLVVAPLFHSLGLQILAIPVIYSGASLFLQDRFDPVRVWRAVTTERITYFGGVPSMHQRLYDALETSSAPRAGHLRFIFSAGSAISTELIRSFWAQGILVIQGYGQTETSTLCCLSPADALRKVGTVGRPVHHAELRIVRPETVAQNPAHWQEAESGETGEIVVRGPINMVGYWEKPGPTAETLIEDWLRTGDLAQQDREGFVTLVGRAREMLISGGENVYPAEVEAVYREHPGIREIAIIGIPDPTWGEVGRAHILPEPGHSLDPQALEEWARERLAAFKTPREVIIETELPRTASGKVKKHLLRGPG